MDSHRRWWALLGGVLMACGMATSAFAAKGDETLDFSYVNGAMTKLGRGIADLATCPLELIRMPTLVGRRDGNLAAMTVGIAQGAVKTLQRGVTGAFEVVTFFAEVPLRFGPLMKPEYVWAHGDWQE